jgi:hypothetical protein
MEFGSEYSLSILISDICAQIYDWIPDTHPTLVQGSFVFSAYLTQENLFSAIGKVPAMLYWDLLTSGRYQPFCYWSKSEKTPALLYVGEGPEYRLFRDLRSVPKYSALLLYENSSIQ